MPSLGSPPLVIMLLIFTIYPLIYSIWLSFHEYAPFKRRVVPVGLENWNALFSDDRFWDSISVPFTHFSAMLVVQTVLGMAIALLLDSERKGFRLLRTLLTLALVIPPAITGMMFLLIEDPEFGVLTWILESVGILDGINPILATGSTALLGIMLADAWQQTFSFIKWGYGATISLVCLILILIIANLFIWLSRVRR